MRVHFLDVCRGQDLSDNQLLRVVKKLGQEWEEAAIYLELSITDLDNIKAERQMNVSMQKLKMLVLWKNRRPRGEATAQHLLSSLEDLKDLSCEARQILEDGNKKTKVLSEIQLMRVAGTLGQEWEQAAIYLKRSITDLDNIKAERQTSVSMQKLKMLVLWKNRRPRGEATAQQPVWRI
ncbi:hypothetical protein NHX12_008961 [Muraenolepis orangiensis]|uniref:Death domain-containing protein n=1 Tax=Muraenolepis orangiensis TaxID=630683 RepID=A0A9Q0DMB2_9TELE|nr:hypothetical protein NHX12_008961 [Muraenolepis orangiensis]